MRSLTSVTEIKDATQRLGRYASAAILKNPDPDLAREAFLEILDRLLASYDGTHRPDIESLKSDWDGFPGLSPGDRKKLAARTQRLAHTLSSEVSRTARAPRKPASASIAPDRRRIPGPLEVLPGVGPHLADRLEQFGFRSVMDLIWFLPRRYEDRRNKVPLQDLRPGTAALVEGVVVSLRRFGKGRRQRTEMVVEEGFSKLRAVWFRGMGPSAAKYGRGTRVLVAGNVTEYKGMLQMAHPDIATSEDPGVTGRITTVYRDIPGIPPRTLAKIARAAMDLVKDEVTDGLPEEMLARRNLPSLRTALLSLHHPPEDLTSEEVWNWTVGLSPGRARLAYDEFLHHQIAAAKRREGARSLTAHALPASTAITSEVEALFGFSFTAAQARAANEILGDLGLDRPMMRLLQGDVGSGKTAVAAAAVVNVLRTGYQAAFMAPTEILARQHHQTLAPLMERLGFRTALVLGGMRAKVQREVREGLERGEIRLAIGTHAVIEGWVSFRNLALCVIDEQHRFGVYQRMALSAKGDAKTPHLLVMTATPIPRTLAHAVWGELDLTVLDELPPGRVPAMTRVFSPSGREEAYRIVDEEVAQGAQAFVICPIIEESEESDLSAVEAVYEELQARYGKDRVELMHGRLSSEDKEETMLRFAQGDAAVLVSTTVVEVGVDVPRARVMVVEGADRFGLCQLHQLRGRVGRRGGRSHCLLIPSSDRGRSSERLQILTETGDGFRIAEEDLRIRGPGQLFGARQAGLPGFKYGNLMRDAKLLSWAREDAHDLLGKDPRLASAEMRRMIEALEQRHGPMDRSVAEEAG